MSNVTHSTSDVWAPLRSSRTTMLTTFRRSGQGVGTPVSIIIVGDKIYFTTWTTSGKTKRLAHTPRVTMAACTQRGKVTGTTVEGVARRLSESEGTYVRNNVLKKSFWGEVWHLIYSLRGLIPVLYEVVPGTVTSSSETASQ